MTRRNRWAIFLAGAVVLVVLLVMLAVRRGRKAARAGAASQPEFDLTGEWTHDWTKASDHVDLANLSADRMQVENVLDASGSTVQFRELAVGSLSLPSTFTPQSPDDFATFEYLRQPTLRVFPTGMIIMWTNPDEEPGGQWVPCDGRRYALGAQTITVPDLRSRLIKAAASDAGAGGSSQAEVKVENMPRHNHGRLFETTWTEGTHMKTTGAAGEHSHRPVKANFCPSFETPPLLPNTITCKSTASQLVDVPFYMRAARRNATSGTLEAYTTADAVGSLATNFKDSEPSDEHSHRHTIELAHTHTMPFHGAEPAMMDTVPGRVYVGFYMSVPLDATLVS
jgi:hypothetical protein